MTTGLSTPSQRVLKNRIVRYFVMEGRKSGYNFGNQMMAMMVS
jgi:hypothetical protein